MEEPAFFLSTGKHVIYDPDRYVQEFLFDYPGETIEKISFVQPHFRLKKFIFRFCDRTVQMDPTRKAEYPQTLHQKTLSPTSLKVQTSSKCKRLWESYTHLSAGSPIKLILSANLRQENKYIQGRNRNKIEREENAGESEKYNPNSRAKNLNSPYKTVFKMTS